MLAEQCHRRILWPGLLLVIVLSLACGTATGPADSTSTTTGTQSAPSNVAITIVTPEGIGPNSDPITGPRARAPENSPAPGKVRLTDTNGQNTDHRVIVDDIRGSRYHNGCSIGFGPDGKLYMTMSDAQDADRTQDLESLTGRCCVWNQTAQCPPTTLSPVPTFIPQGTAIPRV